MQASSSFQWLTLFQDDDGNTAIKSCCTLLTSLDEDSPHRSASRCTCVSTAIEGMLNSWDMITDAVLCPTPVTSGSSGVRERETCATVALCRFPITERGHANKPALLIHSLQCMARYLAKTPTPHSCQAPPRQTAPPAAWPMT